MKNYNLSKENLKFIKREIENKFFKSIYDNAIRHATSQNKGLFEDAMQKLITKIGVIVKSCVGYNKPVENNESAIRCISFAIGDNSVYKYWYATDVNLRGNCTRHSEEYIFATSDFKEIIHQYNRIIKKLVECGFADFTQLYINIKPRRKGEFAQDCLVEKHSIKHILLGSNRIKFLLSPSFSYDEYSKVISTNLTLFWEDNTDDKVMIKVTNSKTGKSLVHECTTLGDSKRKSYRLEFTNGEIENSFAQVDVIIQLKRKETRTFTRKVPLTIGKFRKQTIMVDQSYDQLVEYVACEERLNISNTLDKRYR